MAKVRNNSIDIFRYICAIMVIGMHTLLVDTTTAEQGYTLIQIISRTTVPFFFAVAGFFYIKKLVTGQKIFLKYISRIILVYAVWSAVYLLEEVLMKSISGELTVSFFIDFFIDFIFYGSWYHFWFFPALIYSICITTLIYKIKCFKFVVPISILAYLISVLGSAYYELGTNIPVLGSLYNFSDFEAIRRIVFMGFPFFVIGYVVELIKNRFEKFNAIWLVIVFLILCSLEVAEVFIIDYFELQTHVLTTIMLYPVVCLTLILLFKHPLPGREKLSNTTKILSNVSYYAHPLVIMAVNMLFIGVLKLNLTPVHVFLITTILCAFAGLIIMKINNKHINKFVQ